MNHPVPQVPQTPQIPEQPPNPGGPGEGQLPVGNDPVVLRALSLVPAGLTAVAVFPPFLTPRDGHDAIAVIFEENNVTNRRNYPTYEKSTHASNNFLREKVSLLALFRVYRENRDFSQNMLLSKNSQFLPNYNEIW